MSTPKDVIEPILAELVARWRIRYGMAVAHFKFDEASQRIGGHVLTRSQAAEVALKLVDRDIGVNLRILEDRSEAPPLGFVRPKGAKVSLVRAPEHARLTTEILAGEGALRALAQVGGTVLVQADDDTLGWGDADDLQPAAAPPVDPAVLGPGESLAAGPSAVAALREAARPFVEAKVPYVLGGRSMERIDCSGLVSLVFRRGVDAILPRHSMDQKRCGERIGRDSGLPGDLVFARFGSTNIPHVGVLFDGASGLNVVHASQRHGHVVEEPLDMFFEGYRFMGNRRLLGEAG